MFLSKILVELKKGSKNSFSNKNYVNQLNGLISFLKKIKSSNDVKLLTKSLNSIESNSEVMNLKSDLIRYVINIKFTESNTLVNVTDIEGNPKVFLSSGVVGLRGKMKKHQPAAIVKILKSLLLKIKFVGVFPVAIHFIGAKRYHISLSIKLLKNRVFIKSIRNYNLKAYNGCRPKKMKRLKHRRSI